MTKQMTARYSGKCSKCYGAIRVGDAIVWNSESHSARHAECPTQAQATTTAAGSIDVAAAKAAAREYLAEKDRLYWTAGDDDEARYGAPAQRLAATYRRRVAAAGIDPTTTSIRDILAM